MTIMDKKLIEYGDQLINEWFAKRQAEINKILDKLYEEQEKQDVTCKKLQSMANSKPH